MKASNLCNLVIGQTWIFNVDMLGFTSMDFVVSLCTLCVGVGWLHYHFTIMFSLPLFPSNYQQLASPLCAMDSPFLLLPCSIKKILNPTIFFFFFYIIRNKSNSHLSQQGKLILNKLD